MFGRKPKLIAAQAEILDEGKMTGAPTRVGKYAYCAFEYQVEVRPSDQPAYRTVASGLACTACRPERGDVIAVSCDATKGTVKFELDGDVRYDPAIVAKQMMEFADAETAMCQALYEGGTPGVATVVAVRTGRHRFTNVEVRADVHVKTRGEEFDVTIVEWVSENSVDVIPTVGEKRRVRFAPRDRSKIMWWDDEDVVRWRVPTKCPECGAPVDQSTASLAEHPSCDYCHKPLPCEPA
jgi:hypothetical protein